MNRIASPGIRHRRGGTFAYAMVYMTLAGFVLTISGSLLHTLLGASQRNTRLMADLQQSQKLAQKVRSDSESSSSADIAPGQLIFSGKDSSVSWEIDGSVIRRLATRAGMVRERDSFAFRHGTTIHWQPSEQNIISLTITPPSPAWHAEAPDDTRMLPWIIDLPTPSAAKTGNTAPAGDVAQ